MQEEWNKGDAPKQEQKTRERSDSDVARELQAQWEVEESGGTVAHVAESKQDIRGIESSEPKTVDKKNADDESNTEILSSRAGLHRHDRCFLDSSAIVCKCDFYIFSIADENSEEFIMYHYNGLQSATSPARLAHFVLQKRY